MASEPPPNETSDEELLSRVAKHSDNGALRLLICRYAPRAAGYLTKQFRGRLRAPERDQAVNDAFFNVARFAGRFDPKRTFGSWLIRIVHRAALSILRGEKDHIAKELEFDPQHDPADDCDDAPVHASSAAARVQMMEDIIENELTGFEQALARADVAVGGASDSKRLASQFNKSLNTVYVTRSKVREKIKKGILEREARTDRPKGKS